MPNKKLTDIPDHIVFKPGYIKAGSKWQSDYNVAAWLRFEKLANEVIRLHLHWQDEKGAQSICVDQSKITSTSILLSGIARLKVTGQVKAMSISIETANQKYTVDELFVQPVRNPAATKQA